MEATAGCDSLNQLAAFSWRTCSDANSDGIPDTITSPSRSQSWTPDGQGNFTTVTTNGTVCFFRRSGVPPLGWIWPGIGHWPSRTVFPGIREVTWEPFAKAKRRDAASTENPIATISRPSRSQSWMPDGQGNFTTVTTNGTGETRTHDKQNQVTALIDASGNVVERYVYDPYGKVTILSPDGLTVRTSSNYGWSYLHQGGRQDTATGLLNFRNRDYSTSPMRWTTNDPIGFAGGDTNTYRYVGNGPGNGLDPSGLQEKDKLIPREDNHLGPRGVQGDRPTKAIDDPVFRRALEEQSKNRKDLEEKIRNKLIFGDDISKKDENQKQRNYLLLDRERFRISINDGLLESRILELLDSAKGGVLVGVGWEIRITGVLRGEYEKKHHY